MTFFKLDSHTLNHFAGGYIITLTLVSLGMGSLRAFVFGLVGVAIWELFDEINKRYNLKLWFLDPRGFGLSDFIIGGIGAFLAMSLGVIKTWF